MNRISTVVLIGLAYCFASSPAHAQSLRVTAPEAAVRLQPNAQADVLIKITIGTLLESKGREGEWYAVLLPPDSQGLQRYGYIPATAVEVVQAGIPNLPSAPAAAAPQPALKPPTPLPLDWQQRFDRAVDKKSAGRAKIIGGSIAGAIGAIMSLRTVANEELVCAGLGCTIQQRQTYPYRYPALATSGASLFLITWGGQQVSSANREIIALEQERRNAIGAQIQVSVARHFALMLGVKESVVIGLAASW